MKEGTGPAVILAGAGKQVRYSHQCGWSKDEWLLGSSLGRLFLKDATGEFGDAWMGLKVRVTRGVTCRSTLKTLGVLDFLCYV